MVGEILNIIKITLNHIAVKSTGWLVTATFIDIYVKSKNNSE